LFNMTALLGAMATTSPWSFNTALVMIGANLFAIAIGYYAIQKRGVGPKLPADMPAMFTGFGVPELLATMSFGHIIGTGLILGLSNAGVL
jgi:photosystem I subunit X